MIKVNKAYVEIEGTEVDVAAEIMCLIETFTEEILIPEWASKKNARKVLNKMLETVFEEISTEESKEYEL